MIVYKKVPSKKASDSGKCMGTKNVFNYGKKGLDIKNTHSNIQYADAPWKKSPFYENLAVPILF